MEVLCRVVTNAFATAGEQMTRIGDTDPQVWSTDCAHLASGAADDVIQSETGQLVHVRTRVVHGHATDRCAGHCSGH